MGQHVPLDVRNSDGVTAVATYPRVLRLGGGAAGGVPEACSTLGIERPLFVVDPFFADTPLVAGLRQACGEAPLFSGVVPDPTTDSVALCVAAAAEAGADGLVAIGGGSTIDTAKAAALLRQHGGAMSDYAAPRRVMRPGLPVVAVPTTAGTGSEATGFCVVTDLASSRKFVCIGPGLVPQAAIVDFELTLSVPARLTAEAGLDALTHAVEAFVGRAANPFSDLHAIEAVRLIGRALRRACETPADRSAREDMMRASCLAGLAFSSAGLGLVHAMSAPFGGVFDVPHGLSVAMLLVPVTRFNLPAALPRYAALGDVAGLPPSGTDEERAEAFLRFLDELVTGLHVRTMSGFGVDAARYQAAIPAMAEMTPKSGAAGNNARAARQDEIEALFRGAWA